MGQTRKVASFVEIFTSLQTRLSIFRRFFDMYASLPKLEEAGIKRCRGVVSVVGDLGDRFNRLRVDGKSRVSCILGMSPSQRTANIVSETLWLQRLVAIK